jgi:ferrous iron transport protein A
MSLSNAKNGDNLILISVNKGTRMKSQLAQLGLIEGTTIKMINQQHRGPVVIEVLGTRIAIGHNLASQIFVKRIEND